MVTSKGENFFNFNSTEQHVDLFIFYFSTAPKSSYVKGEYYFIPESIIFILNS